MSGSRLCRNFLTLAACDHRTIHSFFRSSHQSFCFSSPTSLAGFGMFDTTATAPKACSTSKQGTATVGEVIKGVVDFQHEHRIRRHWQKVG